MAGVSGIGGATRVVVSDGRDYDVQIARLRRQANQLERKARDVAASDADPTAKQSQQALLRAKIAMIEADIARLQSMKREERAASRDPGPVMALSVESSSRNVIEEYSDGGPVDVLA